MIALIGSGLASLTAYATLRRGGFAPDEIVVLGDEPDPAAAWARRAGSIRQRRMRSESDGHCLPSSFPGLAVRAALRRRSPAPLAATLADRFHPTVEEFLEHVDRVRRRSGWDESFRQARVGRVSAADGAFDVDGHGAFRHVLLAPGHPPLAVPDELRGDPRAVHAYEPHEYADEVTVVGAGMAAAHEWLNALAAGSTVISVRRREPERRPLNVPRPLFSKRGLASFHRLEDGDRAAALRRLTAPSYPPGRTWDEPLARAARERRFRVEAEVNGSPQVICATGFERGWSRDALLARLVAEHGLATMDAWLVLAPDCTVPGLTDGERTLALAGAPAQWAFPAADTFAGMRYSAHGFLRRVKACRTR